MHGPHLDVMKCGHLSIHIPPHGAGFAIVKLAVDRKTNEEYACKIMALPQPGQELGDNENTRWGSSRC
jgi:hypothetical protein